jgi:hypothetical protein
MIRGMSKGLCGPLKFLVFVAILVAALAVAVWSDARDPRECSCGRHRLDLEHDEDDDFIEIEGDGPDVTVVRDHPDDAGAWWCAPK